jgi:uncharacterized protein YllA (UPF0747 family)
VFCRDINFFYLADGIRSRVEKEGDQFKVVDTEISFSTKEIQNLIDKEPEKFSPNVILRPIRSASYKRSDPAEIVWLQLKRSIQHAQSAFPILMPRFGCES